MFSFSNKLASLCKETALIILWPTVFIGHIIVASAVVNNVLAIIILPILIAFNNQVSFTVAIPTSIPTPLPSSISASILYPSNLLNTSSNAKTVINQLLHNNNQHQDFHQSMAKIAATSRAALSSSINPFLAQNFERNNQNYIHNQYKNEINHLKVNNRKINSINGKQNQNRFHEQMEQENLSNNNVYGVKYINNSTWNDLSTGNAIDINNNHNNRNEYFDQINARNHRPIAGEESQPFVSISNPNRDLFNKQEQDTSPNGNIHYYSPKSYGKSSSTATLSSSPSSSLVNSRTESTPITETQQSPYIYITYSDTTPNSVSNSVMTSMDRMSTLSDNHSQQNKINNGEQLHPISSSYLTIIPNSTGSSLSLPMIHGARSLFQKYYNQDLSTMSDALNRHSLKINNKIGDSKKRILK